MFRVRNVSIEVARRSMRPRVLAVVVDEQQTAVAADDCCRQCMARLRPPEMIAIFFLSFRMREIDVLELIGPAQL